jgi:hypothetical protein
MGFKFVELTAKMLPKGIPCDNYREFSNKANLIAEKLTTAEQAIITNNQERLFEDYKKLHGLS